MVSIDISGGFRGGGGRSPYSQRFFRFFPVRNAQEWANTASNGVQNTFSDRNRLSLHHWMVPIHEILDRPLINIKFFFSFIIDISSKCKRIYLPRFKYYNWKLALKEHLMDCSTHKILRLFFYQSIEDVLSYIVCDENIWKKWNHFLLEFLSFLQLISLLIWLICWNNACFCGFVVCSILYFKDRLKILSLLN
jgi:hypothetical protein